MFAAAAFLLVVGAVVPARADEMETCLGAAERGEQQKKLGQLVRARTSLASCARDICPPPVRTMCRRYLNEVDSVIPTLEVVAHDPDQARLTDITVTIDGEPGVSSADGTYPVDPGARKVRVERGGLAEEVLVKISVGQKRTPVVVTLGAKTPALVTTAPPPPSRPERAHTGPVPWILGGVGVVALATSGAFGIKWMSDSDCKPACGRDDVRRIERDALFADLSLGVGLISLGIATVWLITAAPPSPPPPPATTTSAAAWITGAHKRAP